MSQNFTPIESLINQLTSPQSQPTPTGNVEKREPIGAAHLESPTPTEAYTDEQDDKQTQEYIANNVEIKNDIPDIPADVAAAGVAVSGVQPWGLTPKVVELPLKDEEIPAGLKKPVSSGMRWLAEICVYMLKKAHLKIKQIHGKVMRVKE